MADLAKIIIGLGISLIVVGGVLLLLNRIPTLPGDIYIKRGNFTLYFPITTCILLSILLSLILLLLSRR